MAIREYIGARYVPKFYDDGHGGADWTPDVQYEPLTIVIHNGISYTSRQYVPVGADIENTTYWLETGNWNSQVEQYRQEVLQFDGRITENTEAIEQEVENRTEAVQAEAATRAESDTQIRNDLTDVRNLAGRLRNVVTIGDSWAQGWNGSQTITGWTTYFKNALGLDVHHKKEDGGAGFAKTGQSTNATFAGMLTTLANSLSTEQKAKVQLVLAAGGVNDRTESDTAIMNGIRLFCEEAKRSFPNAKIMIACISAINTDPDGTWQCMRVLRNYTKCGKYGAGYITNIEYGSFGYTFDSTGRHLLDYQLCGEYLAAGAISGSVDIQQLASIQITPLEGGAVPGGSTFNLITSNDTSLMSLAGLRVQMGSPITLEWNNGTKIANWSVQSGSNAVVRDFGFDMAGSAMVRTDDGVWHGVPSVLRFRKDGALIMKIAPPEGLSLPSVDQITVIGPWSISLSLVV